MEPEDLCRPVRELLGERYEIDDIDRTSDNALSQAAFELYKETVSVVVVTSHVYQADPKGEGLQRNQAISVGLLVRIAKFMIAVIELSANSNRGDVVLALNRSIFESSTNIWYLVTKNDDQLYSQFVASSLGPERELFDTIQHAVKKRGSMLPIEMRMLRSIERTCQGSGLKIEDVGTKHGNWGGSFRERLKFINLEASCVAIQRLASHAVHGSWVD
jgi:hypothetical protein